MGMTDSEREELLKRWVQPSSPTEQERLERAERMINNAIKAHPPFERYRHNFSVYAKGSYANKTNVRREADVDIVVENHDVFFHDYLPGIDPDPNPNFQPYTGPWAPNAWRTEVETAMHNYFGSSEVDTTGDVAITIAEKESSRPSADVAPAFLYRRYDSENRVTAHEGSKVFKKSGGEIINYPKQQLRNGNAKDASTNRRYKQFARALKNAENTLVAHGAMKAKPSYFMECLVWNVPNATLTAGWTLSSGFGETLAWLYNHLHAEYKYEDWTEPNDLKYLFAHGNKWTVGDGQELLTKAWNYLDY